MAVRARELADSLGLTGRHVFFNEKWVPYNDRQNFLLDADVGVSTHFEHIETTFSFRTRILDYLWTHLPIVTTRGDGFGDLVIAEGLGVAVRNRIRAHWPTRWSGCCSTTRRAGGPGRTSAGSARTSPGTRRWRR